jgi:alpha-L-fucosidase
MKNISLVGLLALIGLFQANAQWSILEDDTSKQAPYYLLHKFTPEEWKASNYASKEKLEWFTSARYGMFIHFGLSTYVGRDLSWGICYTRKAPDKGHGNYPDSVWTKWPQNFEFSEFDAQEWVDIAREAGMKYMVVIAKHHDGFHLWDTKYSDFKITNTPFGRDYLKEIADACHKSGMKFGIYYSQRDWYHPDYAPVDTSVIDRVDNPPYFKVKEGLELQQGPGHKQYIEYQFNAVRELCSNYGKVDVFWFDACWWGGMFTADMWDSEKLTRMVRELQPGIIINNRASLPGDFDTPEQKIGMYQSPRPWESCVTLCRTWSWSPTPVKSTKTIIQMLTSTACGNGNLLLSWGPKWEGAFDTLQVRRLKEVGEWLESYGHTIYNTKGGPWHPEKWGGSTCRGKKAFVHITGEIGEHMRLPAIGNKLVHADCLTDGEVKFAQNGEYIDIKLEKAVSDQVSIIVELTFENDLTSD